MSFSFENDAEVSESVSFSLSLSLSFFMQSNKNYSLIPYGLSVAKAITE